MICAVHKKSNGHWFLDNTEKTNIARCEQTEMYRQEQEVDSWMGKGCGRQLDRNTLR